MPRPAGLEDIQPSLEDVLNYVEHVAALVGDARPHVPAREVQARTHSRGAQALSDRYQETSGVALLAGDVVTSHGRQIYQWARRWLEGHAAMFRLVEQRRNPAVVVVGTSNRLVCFELAGVIARFPAEWEAVWRTLPNRASLPKDVNLRLREYDYPEMLEELQSGVIDFGVGGVPPEGDPEGILRLVFEEQIPTKVISRQDLGAGYRYPIARLTGERLIVVNTEPSRALAGVTVTGPRVIVDNYTSVYHLVNAGAGIGLVPDANGMALPDGVYAYDVAEQLPCRAAAVWLRLDPQGRVGYLTETAVTLVREIVGEDIFRQHFQEVPH